MPNDTSTLILVVSWTETCIGLIFFTLRFLSNWKVTGRFRWDFAFSGLTVVGIPIVFSLIREINIKFCALSDFGFRQVTETAGQIFLQLSINAGMGRHWKDLHTTQRVAALKWGWVFQLLAIGASMLGKLAIMAFLIQIRGRHERKPWLLIVLGTLIGAVNITVMGTILGQCKPMQKLWDNSIEGTCDPGRKLNQDYSFFQASPCHFLLVLALYRSPNALTSLLIWASTEAWIIIVVGCVPPIRPLMERVFQALGLTSKKTSTPYRSPGPGNYAAFDTNRTNRTGNSGFQSGAYGPKKLWRGDDETWIELNDSEPVDSSKEHIVGGAKDVVVTTDIITRFEHALS
ncbi:hypothetical protein N7462_004878 [Penicillium macrosclerotiorum]|uniref:uncharacterized protein n=1 Tax=Penicillium macrosclerotiorum TaxID=303699 RepID=UPI002547368A|nr:uncharacterized protein N7462_004878 [Penicillium macrosclerotiorum]KAJ5690486.1 hypothetical protein N7462_004878 [Penicillium macrosclerotiorum]